MQERKDFTPKLFYELSLDRLVPKEDFYRKVNQYLDLHFLYKATEKYYGREGQQSIENANLNIDLLCGKNLPFILP